MTKAPTQETVEAIRGGAFASCKEWRDLDYAAQLKIIRAVLATPEMQGMVEALEKGREITRLAIKDGFLGSDDHRDAKALEAIDAALSHFQADEEVKADD